MLVILLGSAQSGKDTFARELTRDFDFHRFAFGDEVRREILISLEKFDSLIQYSLVQYLTNQNLKEQIIPLLGVTGRALMQSWGEHRKISNKYFWISRIIQKCNVLLRNDPSSKLIITDCRFPDELESLKFWYSKIMPDFVYTIKIERDGFKGDHHISEVLANREDIEVDYTLTNNGTLGEFKTKAQEFARFLLKEENDGDGTTEVINSGSSEESTSSS